MSLYFSESETNKPQNILPGAKEDGVLNKGGKYLLSLETHVYCPQGKYHEIKHTFATNA